MTTLAITPTFRAGFEIRDAAPRANLVGFCDAIEKLNYGSDFKGLHLDSNSGGPAWNAYIIVTCDDRDTLARFLSLVPDIARKFRVKLIDLES